MQARQLPHWAPHLLTSSPWLLCTILALLLPSLTLPPSIEKLMAGLPPSMETLMAGRGHRCQSRVVVLAGFTVSQAEGTALLT